MDREKSLAGTWDDLSVTERYRTSVGGPTVTNRTRDGSRALDPFRRRLMVSDLVVILGVTLGGLLLSSRASSWDLDPLFAVYSMPFVIAFLWFALLALRGSYDLRTIGLGTEEVRRVVSGTLWTFAFVAGVSYLFRADISRAYAFVSLPLGLVLIVAVRFWWRGWLYRARAGGRFMSRTVVVGMGPAVDELRTWLNTGAYAGYVVVDGYDASITSKGGISAWLDGLDSVLVSSHAEAVALAPTPDAPADAVNRLAWRLEGRQIDLLIAPALLDVAGPRLTMRPVAGLPILHLDEAVLSRPQRLGKRSLDVSVALMMLILLSPIILASALAVRLTSRGPVIYRQERIGREGVTFTMLKLRTMVDNADSQRAELRERHDLGEPAFKLRDDPRVTPVGRFLRRWSIDELPQLLNVLGGSMSLVGPRPHPLDDVNRYEQDAYRRLALKPGLTGLWQVEGRSDLDWSRALQLDVYYIERWTLSGDLVLLARTVRAVLQGRGAV